MFLFIPLEMHPLHWLLSVLGGIVGYGIGLFFDIGFPSVVRFVLWFKVTFTQIVTFKMFFGSLAFKANLMAKLKRRFVYS